MNFYAFFSHFSDFFSHRRPASVLVDIRACLSLTLFITISSQRKHRFSDDKPFTTSAPVVHSWLL
ncbi:phosphoadenosine phosphosulfate reductase, partial [Klebsiella pneumoniae]|nr:phosphoadenosine phosphosulfate reductase [Klebsiella pneumoniae]